MHKLLFYSLALGLSINSVINFPDISTTPVNLILLICTFLICGTISKE